MIRILRSPLRTIAIKGLDGEEKVEKVRQIAKYSVIEDSKGFDLFFSVDRFGKEVSHTIRFDYGTYAGKVMQVSLVVTDKLNDVKVYPTFDAVGKTTFLQNASMPSTDMSIARIVFNRDCSDVVILLCKDSEEVQGFENILCEREECSGTGYLAKYSSFFAELLKKRKIKAEMLNHTDVYATIAYLEAQVDVLTRIVLFLAPESGYKDLLQAADRYSVLAIKSKEAMIEEFERDKQSVRRLQRRYYDAKRRL